MNTQDKTIDQNDSQAVELHLESAEQIKTLLDSELLWVGGGSGTVIF